MNIKSVKIMTQGKKVEVISQQGITDYNHVIPRKGEFLILKGSEYKVTLIVYEYDLEQIVMWVKKK